MDRQYGRLERYADPMVREVLGTGLGPRVRVCDGMLETVTRNQRLYEETMRAVWKEVDAMPQAPQRPLTCEEYDAIAKKVAYPALRRLPAEERGDFMTALTFALAPALTPVVLRGVRKRSGSHLTVVGYQLFGTASEPLDALVARRRAESPLTWFLESPDPDALVAGGAYREHLVVSRSRQDWTPGQKAPYATFAATHAPGTVEVSGRADLLPGPATDRLARYFQQPRGKREPEAVMQGMAAEAKEVLRALL